MLLSKHKYFFDIFKVRPLNRSSLTKVYFPATFIQIKKTGHSSLGSQHFLAPTVKLLNIYFDSKTMDEILGETKIPQPHVAKCLEA